MQERSPGLDGEGHAAVDAEMAGFTILHLEESLRDGELRRVRGAAVHFQSGGSVIFERKVRE